MRKSKLLIFIIAVILVLTCIVPVASSLKNSNESPFYVEIVAGDNKEIISAWKNEKDEYFVFLPSCADLSNAKIKLKTNSKIVIDGKKLKNNTVCDNFEFSTAYQMEFSVLGIPKSYKIYFEKSENVPAMYIDTQSGSMDYIHQNKENSEKGNIRLYTSSGEIDFRGELEKIKGRGNSTWSDYDKKPYSLEFKDNVDLLDMGAAKRWCLLANADDTSNIRNKFVYDFSKDFGLSFSPDCEWVELYLNGNYVGLYLLSERNEINENRVNISPDNSFLVSMEMESRLIDQNITYVSTDANQYLRVHNPINSNKNDLEFISNICQSAENAILAENDEEWQKIIDKDSWIKKYLIEEVFGNYDACYLSQYFYYNGGKLYAGPVWDFDHSLSNDALWHLDSPQALYANRLEVKKGVSTPWFYSLYNKESFYKEMVFVYQNEFLPLLNEYLNSKTDGYILQIDKASNNNNLRWFGLKNYNLSSKIKEISNYLTERRSFLTDIWINNREYYQVKADSDQGLYYLYLNVFSNECLDEYPRVSDNEFSKFLGWYDAETNEKFDINTTIENDICIYVKWQDSASNKLNKLLNLIPLAVIAFIGVILGLIELKRFRGGRKL